jgi:hypothetical protein
MTQMRQIVIALVVAFVIDDERDYEREYELVAGAGPP